MTFTSRVLGPVLFILVLLASNTQSHAQDYVTDQQQQQFLKACLAKGDARMSVETHRIFCECTAYQIKQNLSIEDVQNMNSRDPKIARAVANKVILDVYAPCMEFPVRDLIFTSCKQKNLSNNVCSCLSSQMGEYTAETAQKHLFDVLQRQPNIVDPMGPIVESPAFQKKEQEVAQQCALQGLQGR